MTKAVCCLVVALAIQCSLAVQAPAHKNLLSTAAKVGGRTSPALQPHDTFDEDYPIDNSHLTPSQLRYQAQADYAKAVAKMKEEESEFVAAKARVAAAQKAHEDAIKAKATAEAAKAKAKAEAARAAEAVKAAQAQLEKAKAASGGANGDVAGAESKLANEEADLKKAQTAVADAENAEAAAEKSLEEKAAELKSLDEKLNTLGNEQAEAKESIGDASQDVKAAEGDKAAAARDAQVASGALERAEAKAAAEAAHVEAAKAAAAKAAAAKAAAEKDLAENSKSKSELKAAISSSRDSYEAANARYEKEQSELKKAREIVEEKRKELAKHGVHIGAASPKMVLSGLTMAVILAAMA